MRVSYKTYVFLLSINLFCFMELCDRNFKTFIKFMREMNETAANEWFMQIAQVLNYLHIFVDYLGIKPENA